VPRQPLTRRIKSTVFLAGEGKSELGYSRWLARLAHVHGAPIAIQTVGLKGGDPLDLVQQAIIKLRTMEAQRGRLHTKGLLLDDDLLGNADRDGQALDLAGRHQLHLIWQRCAHEGLLLQHFHAATELNPTSSRHARSLLLRFWPEYQKGMDANGYGARLSMDHLIVARGALPELDQFLMLAGWT